MYEGIACTTDLVPFMFMASFSEHLYVFIIAHIQPNTLQGPMIKKHKIQGSVQMWNFTVAELKSAAKFTSHADCAANFTPIH